MPARHGFRRALETAAGATGSLITALLDDVPVTVLIAGSLLRRAGITNPTNPAPPERWLDICSGWVAHGALAQHLLQTGAPPTSAGPSVEPLGRVDDPDGWHETDTLPPLSIRRARRMDAGKSSDPAGGYWIDAFFRDSRLEPDGTTQTGIHEYALTVQVDSDYVVTQVDCHPYVLPTSDCTFAAASVQRLVGLPLSAVTTTVASTFTGVGTCTHLNDTMRALTGMRDLLARVDPVDVASTKENRLGD
ncbi:MAG TPA: DUF2889 domain-containing protein [Jatrophihabitantaceae bacterium]